MGLSILQRRALAIVPKFTGFLSMIGSGVIIWNVLPNLRKKNHAHSRIMFAMSCFDFVTSFMYALSTWPIPAGAGPLYAAGTTQTCTFQGFFIQLSLAAPMYNLCLATCHLLMVRYRWDGEKLARVEPFIHPIVALIAVGIATAGLPLKIYNNANVWCWIAPNPSDPGRGNNANTYRWAFYYVELWSIIIIVTAIMLSVVFTVVQTEKETAWYQTGRSKRAALSEKVQKQAFLYVSAFYITWIFPTTLRILQTIRAPVPYGIFLCAVIFTPLQGFLNCIVYLRPRYLNRLEKKRRMEKRLEKKRRHIEENHRRQSTFPTSVSDGVDDSRVPTYDAAGSSASNNDDIDEMDAEEALAEANRIHDEEAIEMEEGNGNNSSGLPSDDAVANADEHIVEESPSQQRWSRLVSLMTRRSSNNERERDDEASATLPHAGPSPPAAMSEESPDDDRNQDVADEEGTRKWENNHDDNMTKIRLEKQRQILEERLGTVPRYSDIWFRLKEEVDRIGTALDFGVKASLGTTSNGDDAACAV